eukprot:GEMP01007630.1.p1 GENE.GEMP01007630.1~~GEMP01007630.1.p1  ORF type:complete len:1015 (+),score=220.20 GEMP01007630.1:49-3045(+)
MESPRGVVNRTQWEQFTARRHLLHPPEIFDEAMAKVSILMESGKKFEHVQKMLEESVRKARFYENCLSADKARDEVEANESRTRMTRGTTVSSLGDEREDSQLSCGDSTKLFVKTCKRLGILPSVSGVVLPKGKYDLVLQYGSIADGHAEALSKTLQSADIHRALLRGNNLSGLGAYHILSQLPDTCVYVDLSDNDLGKGLPDASRDLFWVTACRRLTTLQTLNLAGNSLGDRVIAQLCMAFFSCRSLVDLDLSANIIKTSATQLGAWIKSHRVLRRLDLHWNHISGAPALNLVSGLIANSNSRLTTLNLAWNPLAANAGKKVCTSLALFLRSDMTLSHLDLSMCDLLWALQLEVIAEALKENHTLLGLHLTGNMAWLDAFGYLVPRSGASEAVVQQVLVAAHSGAKQAADSRGSPRCNDRSASLSSTASMKNESCWLCHQWREMQFVYMPLDPITENVHVFTSIDDFTTGIRLNSRPMTQAAAASGKERPSHSVHVMCPPGTIYFIFQIGSDAFVTSSTTRVAYDRKVAINDTIIHDVNVAVVPSSLREGEVVCKYSQPRGACEVWTESVETWAVGSSLFAPFAADENHLPRASFEHDWNFMIYRYPHPLGDHSDISSIREVMRDSYRELKIVFSMYCTFDDSPNAMAPFGWSILGFTSFVLDFGLVIDDHGSASLSLQDADACYFATVFRCPNVQERVELHDIVEDDGTTVRRIWVQQVKTTQPRFSEAIPGEDGQVVAVDAANMTCSVAWDRGVATTCRVGKDGEFDLTRAVHEGKDARGNMRVRKLPRCAFIELLIRLAIAFSDGAESVDCAVNKLLTRVVQVVKEKFSTTPAVTWRSEVFQTEAIEAVLRKHLWRLRKIYHSFKIPILGRGNTCDAIRCEDWPKLVKTILPDYTFSAWNLSWIWYNSVMHKPSNDEGSQMCFVEFMEAIVRISLLSVDMTPENPQARRSSYAHVAQQEPAKVEFNIEPRPFDKFKHAEIDVQKLEDFFWDLSV